MNCLQLIQIKQTPFSDWKRNFVDQKASTKLNLKGIGPIMFLGHDGA